MIGACWSDPVPLVPQTLPVAAKVPVPPSPGDLKEVPKHRRQEPRRRMKRWCWICYYVWVEVGWVLPCGEPLSQWWPCWQVSPRGSGAFTRSSGLLTLSTRRFTLYDIEVLC